MPYALLAQAGKLTLRTIGLLFIFGAGCASPSADIARPVEPANLGDLKAELLDYQKSGAYDAGIAAVDKQAGLYLKERAAKVAKPALVLDIDETSLSNWPQLKADDFGYFPGGSCDALPAGPCGEEAWDRLGQDNAISPTLALFQLARAEHVAIFLITGRPETFRQSTERNLKQAGYDGWTQLVMRTAGSHTASAADFKTPERAKIEAMGYTILVNVGDQPSDLAGGHAERGFLLPDPFYRIP